MSSASLARSSPSGSRTSSTPTSLVLPSTMTSSISRPSASGTRCTWYVIVGNVAGISPKTRSAGSSSVPAKKARACSSVSNSAG